MYQVEYKFKFGNQDCTDYIIKINPETMINQIPIPDKIPFWARLSFKQCKCCTLTEEQSPHCPIATNIAGLVETFKNNDSFDKCQVTCQVPERMYVKETDVQTGLFSIYGLVTATSTCPAMVFLKPMARFHLPFASIEESITRIAAYYLLGQYFERKMGNCVDMELKTLDEYIEKVALVDEGIIGRLRDVTEKDADKNAFAMLHSMATMLSLGINEKLEDYDSLFAIRQKK